MDDTELRKNWKVIHIVQIKRLWDVPKADDIKNDEVKLLEVGGIGVDKAITYQSYYRDNVNPMLVD